MHHSMQDRLLDKKQRLLTKDDLSGLSPEQREFAEEQFRLIYAQQMSKVTAEMSHKKKILDNLQSLDETQSKNLKQQYDKLKTKMASIQQNRNKKLQQKVKTYKQNDDRWFRKLKQIQTKFKQQNRQAIQKAKKYRQQSQNYWKSKEKRMQDNSKTNFDNSRTIKHDGDSLHRSFIVEKTINNQKYHQIFNKDKKHTINQDIQKSHRDRQESFSKPQIDTQIRIHREKSDNLQREKQTLVFQKALQKMQKIEQNRAKALKQKQSKVSEPTKPKVANQNRITMDRRGNNKHHSGSSVIRREQSKDSLQKIIKDHLQVKQRIQQQQFMQRGEILQNNIQKTRKDKILRMIKSKVHDMKVNTLMKQGSKNALIS